MCEGKVQIWSHFYPAELGAFLAPTKGKKRQAFAAPALSPALRCTRCHHLHGTLLRNTLREKQPGGVIFRLKSTIDTLFTL